MRHIILIELEDSVRRCGPPPPLPTPPPPKKKKRKKKEKKKQKKKQTDHRPLSRPGLMARLQTTYRPIRYFHPKLLIEN